jgi:chromosome partitioning protein
MHVIAFVNFKGGVTKTSSAVGLGAALALKNYRVLLVDCDPQGHIALHLGIEREKLPNGLEDVFKGRNVELEDIITPTGQNNLFVAPSRRALLHARQDLLLRKNSDALLAKSIRALKNPFDFILIDTPPDEGILSVNAMYASRYIIIPTVLDSFSLDGINTLINSILELRDAYEEKEWDVLGILINRLDGRLITANNQNLDTLYGAFGDNKLILATKIRTDEQIKEAQRQGKTIFQHDPSSKGAKDFDALANEILKKLDMSLRD